jgi:hypothetical protein
MSLELRKPLYRGWEGYLGYKGYHRSGVGTNSTHPCVYNILRQSLIRNIIKTPRNALHDRPQLTRKEAISLLLQHPALPLPILTVGTNRTEGLATTKFRPLEIHNHRASIVQDVACCRISMADSQPM